MNLREQFEARFPVPDGVQWSEEHQNYGWIKKTAFQRTITYRALWTGWQESRAALVVVLPGPAVPGGNCIRDHAVREAIEAAGVKVAL